MWLPECVFKLIRLSNLPFSSRIPAARSHMGAGLNPSCLGMKAGLHKFTAEANSYLRS